MRKGTLKKSNLFFISEHLCLVLLTFVWAPINDYIFFTYLFKRFFIYVWPFFLAMPSEPRIFAAYRTVQCFYADRGGGVGEGRRATQQYRRNYIYDHLSGSSKRLSLCRFKLQNYGIADKLRMEINENNLSQLAVYLQQTLSPAADVRQEFICYFKL